MHYGPGMVDAELGTAAFWIMTALADGRRHGYGILREVAAASDGAATLRATTLYAALDRLDRDGLVAADGEEIVDGRARRYFVLTEAGAVRLDREVVALEARVRRARARLAARPA